VPARPRLFNRRSKQPRPQERAGEEFREPQHRLRRLGPRCRLQSRRKRSRCRIRRRKGRPPPGRRPLARQRPPRHAGRDRKHKAGHDAWRHFDDASCTFCCCNARDENATEQTWNQRHTAVWSKTAPASSDALEHNGYTAARRHNGYTAAGCAGFALNASGQAHGGPSGRKRQTSNSAASQSASASSSS
jgi:hypothetical protein